MSTDIFYLYGANSIESNYPGIFEPEDPRVIIRDDITKTYRVYQDHQAAADMIVPPVSYHEVIPGSRPQKIKFDLDAATGTAAMLKEFIETLCDAWYIIYNCELDINNLIICSSCADADNKIAKFSYHIIIDNFCVGCSQEAAEFYRLMHPWCGPNIVSAIDFGVNKSMQNFRTVGSAKVGTTRTKKICGNYRPEIVRTFITYVEGCTLLPTIIKESTTYNEPITVQDHVLNVCNYFAAAEKHEYKMSRGNILIYQRTAASFCSICCRTHENDNSLIIVVQKDDSRYKIYKKCRRDPTGSAVLLDTISDDNNDIMPPESPTKPVPIKPISGGRLYIKGAKINRYSDENLHSFEDSAILFVSAAMKMGKTKKLVEHINSLGDIGPIVFISFRQTFSSNIKEKFPNFTMYSEIRGPIHLTPATKLIIQVESLHRVAISLDAIKPGLVVMDESESIIEQFGSGLLRNFNMAFAAFKWLIKSAGRVICLDAALGERTVNVIKALKYGVTETAAAFDETVVLHDNTYQNATEDTYYITLNKLVWLGALHNKIAAGKKVAIPIASLAEAKALEKTIAEKYPALKVKLYSSESNMSERQEHFAHVNVYWKQYDVLIYTPTVTAGVSFECAHFDYVFGYFANYSCNVQTCVQMIGRIRNVAAKNYIIFIDNIPGVILPTERNDIRAALIGGRESLLAAADISYLQFDYGDCGQRLYINNPYLHLWIENARCKNLSINQFYRVFVAAISHTGAAMYRLDAATYKLLTGEDFCASFEMISNVASSHSKMKQEIKKIEREEIAAAEEMSDLEAAEIKNKIALQQDVTKNERNKLTKYSLRRTYRYTKPIDQEFIETYSSAAAKRTFKYLNSIYGHEDPHTALVAIKQRESKRLNEILNGADDYQYLELHTKYTYEIHKISIGFITLCGFKNIYDPNMQPLVELYNNFKTAENAIIAGVQRAAAELEISGIKLSKIFAARDNAMVYVKEILSAMNKILSAVYDITIKSTKENDIYMIKNGGLFTPLEKDRRPHYGINLAAAFSMIMPEQAAATPPENGFSDFGM